MPKNLPEPPDYETAYKEAVQEQVRQTLSLVENNNSGMREKIENFCDKFGEEYNTIRQKIIDDPIFALCFAKDPGKQKFHEKLAAAYIKKLPFVENFKDSPKDAKVVVRGGVQTKESGSKSSAKTIDFTWNYGAITFYASHKYTKESGGSQDHQYNELLRFLEEANISKDKSKYFLAIADGAYYSKADASADSTKMQNLKDTANNRRNVYAMSINELADFLIKVCEIEGY